MVTANLIKPSLSGSSGDFADYKVSDSDTAADPSYFGYLDKNANWYILELNEAAGTFRYAKGDTGYVVAWSNRASLSYVTVEEAFG